MPYITLATLHIWRTLCFSARFTSILSTFHSGEINPCHVPQQASILYMADVRTSTCAPRFEDRTFQEALHQERCARKQRTRSRSTLSPELKQQTHFLRRSQIREFEVDSGASVHMLRKKASRSAELETLWKCRNATSVIATQKCKQVRKHKYTSTTLSSSWRCKSSMTRLQSCN